MRKFWSIAILATLFVATPPAHAGEWQKTYEVTGVPALSLDADDASVEVRGWDRNEISVRVVSDRGIGVGANDDVRVRESQNGNAVSVHLERPHHVFRIQIQWRETRVEVRVPKRSRLDISTGDGACEVVGIDGDAAIETGDGAIRAEDMAGHIRFETGDGPIRASGVSGDLLARTSDGRIEVFGTFSRLDLESSDGTIVAGAGPGSTVDEPWRLQTSDGSITLRIPESLAADLDARSDDGGIRLRSERPLHGEIESHYARVELNGGGPPIRLRSSDGSIRIERY